MSLITPIFDSGLAVPPLPLFSHAPSLSHTSSRTKEKRLGTRQDRCNMICKVSKAAGMFAQSMVDISRVNLQQSCMQMRYFSRAQVAPHTTRRFPAFHVHSLPQPLRNIKKHEGESPSWQYNSTSQTGNLSRRNHRRNRGQRQAISWLEIHTRGCVRAYGFNMLCKLRTERAKRAIRSRYPSACHTPTSQPDSGKRPRRWPIYSNRQSEASSGVEVARTVRTLHGTPKMSPVV